MIAKASGSDKSLARLPGMEWPVEFRKEAAAIW